MKKVLPIEKLMDYADGKLPHFEEIEIKELLLHDPVSTEIVEGLKAIYLNEQLGSQELEVRLGRAERQLEKKIYFHSSGSNHLVGLHQQLRAVAAVLLMVVSSVLLMSCSKNFYWPSAKEVPSAPYGMERGDVLIN